MLPESLDPSAEDLVGRLRDRRVVPVVGAGVSAAVAGVPGWKAIIKDGLDHVAGVGTSAEQEIEDARHLLDGPDLVAAAQRLTRLLGAPGGEFPFWLKSVFGIGRERVHSPRLIHRIIDLLCPVIATTNYDHLVTLLHYDAPAPVTWREPASTQLGLQEGGRVLHLHGVYDKPDTVILGIDDYRELVADPAYRAVLQTLWLDRTLLFIGCSFDGLNDPDFSRLLSWASDTFKGSFYKHYALLRGGTFTTDDVRRFLHDWRIQIVGYGPRFDDLPLALDRLNPHREQARAIRASRARDLLDTGDQANRQALVDLLVGMARPDAPADVDVAAEAATLLEASSQTALQRRGHLSALQRLARTIVDPEAVRRERRDWKKYRRLEDQLPTFFPTVLAAAEALFLVPEEFLATLKQRSVEVHQRVLDGYCEELIREIKNGVYGGDEYFTENLKRILQSLHEILEADPLRVFPDPRVGTALVDRVNAALVVVRRDRLELRRLDSPAETLATLHTEPPFLLRAEAVPYRGTTAIMAFNRERLIAWDPHRAATPIAAYAVSQAYGINSVAHLATPDGLRSVVSTTDGVIHELLDLVRSRAFRVPHAIRFVVDVTLLPSGRLFALQGANGESLVEVKDDGDTIPLLGPKELTRLLQGLPGVPLPDPDDPGGPDRSPPVKRWFQHWDLHSFNSNGQSFLALGSSSDHSHSLVVLLEPGVDDVSLRGFAFYKDQRTTRFTLAPGKDGFSRVIVALLSDFQQTYDLVTWSRATPTTRGLICIPEGSAIRTHDDMVCVTAADPGHGFASDDSGGLFAFSMLDGSSAEIDKDPKSRISDLLIARW